MSHMPSFALRVPHVVALSADEQMVGTYARRVIAVVANVHALGHGTVYEYPCQAMRMVRASVVADAAVALCGTSTIATPSNHRSGLLVPRNPPAWISEPLAQSLHSRIANVASNDGFGKREIQGGMAQLLDSIDGPARGIRSPRLVLPGGVTRPATGYQVCRVVHASGVAPRVEDATWREMVQCYLCRGGGAKITATVAARERIAYQNT